MRRFGYSKSRYFELLLGIISALTDVARNQSGAVGEAVKRPKLSGSNIANLKYASHQEGSWLSLGSDTAQFFFWPEAGASG